MSESFASVTIKLDFRPYLQAISRAAKAMHGFSLALMSPADRRKHKVRCATCSPFANPAPLSIDGKAYRRRTKNRGNR